MPDSLDVNLPVKPTYDGASMQEMIWCIYGPPGIGKSTFVAQCPDVLFLSTDPGLRFLNVMKQPISSWLQFKRVVKSLELNRPKRYKTLAIDTIDPLFIMCRDFVCKKRGIEHQSDEPYGKGYELVNTEFTIEMLKLTKMPYGLFFISHVKEAEVRGRAMRTSMLQTSLPGQAAKIILPLADIVAYYGFAEDSADTRDVNRIMQFQPSETVLAKDRTHGGLPETLMIPEEGGFALVERHLMGNNTALAKKKILIKKR